MTHRALVRMIALTGLAGLTACETSSLAPSSTTVTPRERPAPTETVEPARTPSAESLALSRYYARLQNDLKVRGLLRTDGGGPDTPLTDTMLVRNFASIALEEEYVRGAGLVPSTANNSSAIKKWTQPVRMTVEFGPGVPREQRAGDQRDVVDYAARLSRVTGHPISMVERDANFHVLFMSEDDKALIAPRIRQLVPDVNPASLRLFRNLPRGIHCLVVAFARSAGGYDYGTAIAVIRSEHPDLLRLSCIHEEIAQGMGLGNDDPRARPSIFNDDDEFALLTRHDELLLQILYDPRLTPGMKAPEALPIVRQKAAQLMGVTGPS